MAINIKDIMSQLFCFDPATYYSWKKQERPIIKLVDKYFTRNELSEFLTTGTIHSKEHSVFVMDFYQRQTCELLDLIQKTHFSIDKFYIFSIFSHMLISKEKYDDIDSYYIYMLEKSQISGSVVVDLIKNAPIGNNLYFFMNINIENELKLLESIVDNMSVNFQWIYEYVLLSYICAQKGIFGDVIDFADGERRLPNIPNMDLKNPSVVKTNCQNYKMILQYMIEKVENDDWINIPTIDSHNNYSKDNKEFDYWTNIVKEGKRLL